VLVRASQHNLFVNNPPLSIYLHAGGANAIYYDLVNEEGNSPTLKFRIETSLTIIREALRTRPLLVGS
jgi:hypothetical protein